jgi:hypothetical protein
MRVMNLTAAVAVLVFGSTGIAQDAGKPAVPAPSPTVADAKPAESPSLVVADVRNWKGLAKRLKVMGEADLLPTSAVWKAFLPAAREATKRIARDAAPAAADQKIVLDALNAWIAAKTSAVDASLKPEYVRDPEIHALLKKPSLDVGEMQRLHRLIVESMFPLELAQQPVMVAAKEGEVRRYPPNRLPEVTLSLTVPNLRGRLKMFLPNQETLVFNGENPLTLKVPNDGSLRFAIPGDGYDEPFPRTITWTDDNVKNGVVEKKLPILKGRRTP